MTRTTTDEFSRGDVTRMRALREQFKKNLEHLAIFGDQHSIDDLDFDLPLTMGDLRVIYAAFCDSEELRTLKAERLKRPSGNRLASCPSRVADGCVLEVLS